MINELPVFDYILFKVAARCNINCNYCYWFKDASVYEKPKILTAEAEAAFLSKLREHIHTYGLKRFSILFHGGEPLLIGKKRLRQLCESIREIERCTGCEFELSTTTNGTLIDCEWASIFRAYRIDPTLSIDGPKRIHDQERVDFRGRGTYDRVLNALTVLREFGIEPGVLAVCDPSSDPEEVANHFVEEPRLRSFDILFPDATHETDAPSVAAYYRKLFDLWYDDFGDRVRVAHLSAFVRGILAG